MPTTAAIPVCISQLFHPKERALVALFYHSGDGAQRREIQFVVKPVRFGAGRGTKFLAQVRIAGDAVEPQSTLF